MKKKSWRTTVFGAGGILAVVVAAASALFDGDPTTNPNWNILIAALMPAIGNLFSRDDKVTSEGASTDDV